MHISTPSKKHHKFYHREISLIIAVIGALILTGCATQKDSSELPGTTNQQAAPSNELEKYYTQNLEWKDCQELNITTFTGKCARATIPLDYKDPSQGESYINMGITPSKADHPKGTIFINPGGPGSSGIEAIQTTDNRYNELLKEYNIVGFDPRGVASSDPMKCYSDAKTDELRSAKDPSTGNVKEDIKKAEKTAKALAQECKKNSGPVLQYMDTDSVAQDLDMLRAVMGDEKLNYLGFSYGTELGTRYSNLFPDKVGNMVLDGAVNISLDKSEMDFTQAKGFKGALDNYMDYCLRTQKCPFSGSREEGLKQLKNMVQKVKKDPIKIKGGRTFTDSLMVSGIFTTLYDKDYWSNLSDGLNQLKDNDDPTTLLTFADSTAGRDEKTNTYPENSYYAYNGVTCLDFKVTANPVAMEKEAKKYQKAFPTFGDYFTYGEIPCGNWAYPSRENKLTKDIKPDSPVVIIGTRNDPATPYSWAEALNKQINGSRLLTFEGEGHTAFGKSECVTNTVEAYFLRDKIPEENTQCKS